MNSVSKRTRQLGLMVCLDGGRVKKASDLKGMKIAITGSGNISEEILALALAEDGVKLTEVERVVMRAQDLVAAFKNKAIDGGIQNEPSRSMSVRDGLAVIFREAKDLLPENYPIRLAMFSYKFATEKTEAAKRYQVAMQRAARDYADAFWHNKPNKPEITKILTDLTKRSVEELEQMGAEPLSVDGAVNIKAIEGDQEFYIGAGYLKERVDVAKWVDMTFVNYAIERLGKYQP